MVERFNRILLQLLRAYVASESDWKMYLSQVLYAYWTACHSNTGASPYFCMVEIHQHCKEPPSLPIVVYYKLIS